MLHVKHCEIIGCFAFPWNSFNTEKKLIYLSSLFRGPSCDSDCFCTNSGDYYTLISVRFSIDFSLFIVLSTRSLSEHDVDLQYVCTCVSTAPWQPLYVVTSRHDVLLDLTSCNLSYKCCITKAHSRTWYICRCYQGNISLGPLLSLWISLGIFCFSLSWSRGMSELLPLFLSFCPAF